MKSNILNLILKYKAINYFSLLITSMYIPVSTNVITSIYNTLTILVNKTYNISYISKFKKDN
jgi:hypothetical protein